MKKALVVLFALFLFVAFVSCGETEADREEREFELKLAYEEGYEKGYSRGYEDAEADYWYQVEDLHSALNDSFDRIMRLSNMLEDYEYYTQDELYAAAEDILDYMRDYINR